MHVSLNDTGQIRIGMPIKVDAIANLIQGTRSQRGCDSILSFRPHH